jgi:choline dehydrogenase
MQLFGTYDYIIVGAGAAGCVLANRLTKDPDIRVLLLEAGGKDDWMWIKIPVGYLYCIGNPRTDWCYNTTPQDGLNGRSILYARGKTLGGSTSINAMLYMRGQQRDYDEWAQLSDDESWNWQSVVRHFMKSEDYWRGADEMHATGGEWRVEQQRLHWDILDRFVEAAGQAGIAKSDDFNRGDNSGVGLFEVNQKRGTRWSASRGFLDPIKQRPNLTIVTGALSDKLIYNDTNSVEGIEFIINNKRFYAVASAETILAAGAIGSPAILQRSGIGPAGVLQKAGIEPVLELAGVGQNLQDHLQLRTIFKVEGIKTLNQQYHSLKGKLSMALEYLLFRKGPLSMAPSQLGAFLKSDPSVETPDLEYHVQPLSLDKFGEPLHKFPAFTASICDLRPTSRGYVNVTDNDPASAPAISPEYLSTDEDRVKAAQALRITREIVSQDAFKPFKPLEHLPGIQYQNNDELAYAAGNVGTTIFHPVGTCKMGKTDDPSAVVDSRLRVIGMKGLRVVDASIMPTITSGNTSSPTIMIAEKGSEMILEDR